MGLQGSREAHSREMLAQRKKSIKIQKQALGRSNYSFNIQPYMDNMKGADKDGHFVGYQVRN